MSSKRFCNGFGWRLSGDAMWHSGESIGFRNVIIRWPARHLTVIVLSNRNHFKPSGGGHHRRAVPGAVSGALTPL